MKFGFGNEKKPKSAAEIAQGKFEAKVKRQNTLQEKADMKETRIIKDPTRYEHAHFGELDLIPVDIHEDYEPMEGKDFIPLDQFADPSHDWERFGEEPDDNEEESLSPELERDLEQSFDEFLSSDDYAKFDQEIIKELKTVDDTPEPHKTRNNSKDILEKTGHDATAEKTIKAFFKGYNRFIDKVYPELKEKFNTIKFEKMLLRLRNRKVGRYSGEHPEEQSLRDQKFSEYKKEEYKSAKKQTIDSKKITEYIDEQNKNA